MNAKDGNPLVSRIPDSAATRIALANVLEVSRKRAPSMRIVAPSETGNVMTISVAIHRIPRSLTASLRHKTGKAGEISNALNANLPTDTGKTEERLSASTASPPTDALSRAVTSSRVVNVSSATGMIGSGVQTIPGSRARGNRVTGRNQRGASAVAAKLLNLAR